MLQTFRTHKRWLMFFAMIFIIPSFVVTGIYSYNRMSNDDRAIARVGENLILPEQFDAAKRNYLERLRQQMGADFKANMLDNESSRTAIIRAMMDEAALKKVIARDHLNVSEDLAVEMIKKSPYFANNGKFDAQKYEQFLQSSGKTDQMFVYEVRQDLSKELLLSAITQTYPLSMQSVIVTDMYRFLTERRQVRRLVIDSKTFDKSVKIEPAAIASYYDEHPNEFLRPETLSASYVILSENDFANQPVNDEEVKTYFEQNQDRWKVEEQRSASHILIGFGQDKDAAKKKALDILAKAKAKPAEFAALAKKYSEDPGSASLGGDLDFFGPGMMVPAFEKAVYAAKVGDIVGLVETDFGYHIIEVTGIEPAYIQAFKDVKEGIENEYRQQRAAEQFAQEAETFTNMAYEQSDSLEPLAKKYGLKIQTVKNVTRQGVSDQNLAKIFNDNVVSSLFSDEPLHEKRNTSAIEIGQNRLLVARVVKHFPEATMPFEEVKKAIESHLARQEAARLAQDSGLAQLAKQRSKTSLAKFSQEKWVSRSEVKQDEAALLNNEIALDEKALPAFVGTQLSNGSYVISYVMKNQLVEPKEEDLKALAKDLSGVYGEADRLGYFDALKAELGAEIVNPKFIKEESPN